MIYNAPMKPPPQQTLFDALAPKYANDLMKLQQIKNTRNAQYERPVPMRKKVFSSVPNEVAS